MTVKSEIWQVVETTSVSRTLRMEVEGGTLWLYERWIPRGTDFELSQAEDRRARNIPLPISTSMVFVPTTPVVMLPGEVRHYHHDVGGSQDLGC